MKKLHPVYKVSIFLYSCVIVAGLWSAWIARATSVTTVGTTLFCGPNSTAITPFKQPPDWVVAIDAQTNYHALAGDNSKAYTSNSFDGLMNFLQTTGNNWGMTIALATTGIYDKGAGFVVSNTIYITNSGTIYGQGIVSTLIQSAPGFTGPVFQLGTSSQAIYRMQFLEMRIQGNNSNDIGVYSLNCAEPEFTKVEFNDFLTNINVTNYNNSGNIPGEAGVVQCTFLNSGTSSNNCDIQLSASAGNGFSYFYILNSQFVENNQSTPIRIIGGMNNVSVIAKTVSWIGTSTSPFVDVTGRSSNILVSANMDFNYGNYTAAPGAPFTLFEAQSPPVNVNALVTGNIATSGGVPIIPFTNWAVVQSGVSGVISTGNGGAGYTYHQGDAGGLTNIPSVSNFRMLTNNYNVIGSDAVLKVYGTNEFITNALNQAGKLLTIVVGSATASAILTNNGTIFTLPTGGYATNAVYLGGASGQTNMWTGVCDINGNW